MSGEYDAAEEAGTLNLVNLYAAESIATLNRSRWCFEHNELLFFCEHRHAP